MISLANYFELNRSAKNVRLVTPQDSEVDAFQVYKFNEKNVKTLISEDIKCGVYLIGTVISRVDDSDPSRIIIFNEFRICYFGRSDDNRYPLQQRICDHLANGGKADELHVYRDNMYFTATEYDDERVAYEEELKWFNVLFSSPSERRVGNGYYNDSRYSHDANNGEPYLMPNAVYVDNSDKPSVLG